MRASLKDRAVAALVGLALVLAVLGLLAPATATAPVAALAASFSPSSTEGAALEREGRDGYVDLSDAAAPGPVRVASGARPRPDGSALDAHDRALQAGVSVARLPIDDLDLEPRHLSWRRTARVSPSRMRADLMVFLN